MTPVLHDVSAARRCWVMFWAYFRITALVIGGGYAIIAAAQEEFVTRRKWLTEDDMVEMLTITQTVPGILACNSAIYVGWRIGGLAGAVAAMIGAVVPSLLIITLIAAGLKCVESFLDESAVRGAFTGIIGSIVGMVAVTAIKMRRKTVTGWFGAAVAAACLIGMCVLHLSPAWLILGAIAAGLLKVVIGDWRARRNARNNEVKP